MTQLARRLYTADEFERLQDNEAYELDDGVLKEMCVGAESQAVALGLLAQLWNFVQVHRVGTVIQGETGLRIFDSPLRVPRPDGAFIRAGRLPGGRMPKGFITVAPDLVIESVSPNDDAGYLDRKVAEYLGAGVLLVWVLYPDAGTAMVHRADGTAARMPATGALDGEDVIPGFRCVLATIRPTPEPPEEAAL